MSQVRVIHYDPDAPESAAARAALQPSLLVLARGRDRDAVNEADVELFNLELREVTNPIQEEPELAARWVMELLRKLDQAIEHLAVLSGRSNELLVHQLFRH